MNYITEINGFEQWLETNYLPPMSQLLWYKLVALCNRCGWVEWVTVDNQRLMSLIQLKREATFIDIRNKLIEAGLIEYRKGKKGSPNQYKINTFNLKVQTEVNTVVKSVVKTEVQTADINKQKHKQNNKESIKKNSEKFIAPSLDEIKKYVSDKQLNVDADKFYNYFTEGNWIDSKGNKVKNWKQKILTWSGYSSNDKKDKPQNSYQSNDNQYSNLDKFIL